MTPWTAAHQAPLSMRFPRQGYWSGLPFPSPGDLPNPGIEPGSPALQADSLPSELPGKPFNYYLVLVAQSYPTLCDPMDCSPLSMRFSRQGYWSGLPFPSPGDLPNPGIEPRLLHCRQILYQLSHQGSLVMVLEDNFLRCSH